MNRQLVLCLILWMSIASAAAAQQNAQKKQTRKAGQPSASALMQRWLQMDTDGDEKISSEESQGQIKNNFQRIDTNGDGKLDRDELSALAQRLRSQRGKVRPNAPGRARTISTDELLKRVPEGLTVEPDIAYRDGDSEAWRLDLVTPKDRGDKPRAAIVFVHGGGWRSGDKRTGTFLNGAFHYAQKGYVCITVNYRLTAEAPFPACVEDVKCAVRWLRAHAKKYHVDPKRIGGFGNSAGAHLVAMLGLVGPDADLEGDGSYQDQSSLLQAVCCCATPTDFMLNTAGKRPPRPGSLLAGPEETMVKRAKRASPITYVRGDAPPFLVIHGTADKTVNVEHSDRFVEALKKAGAKDVTFMRIDGAGHGVYNQHAAQTMPAATEFFERTLRGVVKKD